MTISADIVGKSTGTRAAGKVRVGGESAFERLPMPDLAYTPEIAQATAPLYERVRHHIPEIEWPIHAPYVYHINRLKKERDAVILAHNYQTPEIFHCVADIAGDSLQLAQEASRVDANVIVQCGVHFMAETSKLLNPQKTVLIPDMKAGCSLAESITGADVRLLREANPGVPIVTYVNTSAEVKAESDICCTSSNAVAVVESFGVDTVLLIPDEYLAQNVALQTDVKILTWKGHCEVHERFTADELLAYREIDPEIQIVAHPECPTEVTAIADFTGSTSGMIDYATGQKPGREGAARHGMLDGLQHPGPGARRRVHQALQPVPAHEAHHSAQDSRQPSGDEGGGPRRSGPRGAGTARGGAHGEPEELRPSALDRSRKDRHMADQLSFLRPVTWTGTDDILVVGGGLAGLFCALKLAPRPVTILTTAPLGKGASSAWAQAGIAAAVSEGDTIEAHLADTIVAGAGIVDEGVARLMASEAAGRIEDLLSYGVPFDRDLEGRLATSREAAHSANRIVRVRGDMAGRSIMEALIAAVRATPSIRVLESCMVQEILTDGRYVSGVVARDMAGQGENKIHLAARAVVLASGGIGHLYAVTTNPTEARGQGIGMAARAGAIVADMEFVQFHPTAIDVAIDPAPLATEALRGHGATLVNDAGERFMLPLHPRRGARPAGHRRARHLRGGSGRTGCLPGLPARDRPALRRHVPDRLRLLRSRRYRPPRTTSFRSSPPRITSWAAS